MAKNHEIESHLPVTPAMFQILLALADGEKHGYAILKEVAQPTGDKVRLSAGTLYGNLARLESSGMIVESQKRPEIRFDDERRRYYRLTDFGREAAVAEANRMDEALGQARAKNLFRRPRLGQAARRKEGVCSRPKSSMPFSRRAFRALLNILPFDFRENFGGEM